MAAPPLIRITLTLCLAIGALVSVRAADVPIVIAWHAAGAPADVDEGVRMGAAEAQQTATLLNRAVRLDPQAAHPYATIEASGGAVAIAAGERCTYRISPEAADEAARLAAWNARVARTGRYEVMAWHASLKQFGAFELNERFTRQFHAPMTQGAWFGWVAVKATTEAALRSDRSACAALADLQFDGHKGTALSFRNRILQQPLYVIEHTATGDTVAGQVPPR